MAERSGASAAVEAVILGLILFCGMAVLNPGAGVLIPGFAGLARRQRNHAHACRRCGGKEAEPEMPLHVAVQTAPEKLSGVIA